MLFFITSEGWGNIELTYLKRGCAMWSSCLRPQALHRYNLEGSMQQTGAHLHMLCKFLPEPKGASRWNGTRILQSLVDTLQPGTGDVVTVSDHIISNH